MNKPGFHWTKYDNSQAQQKIYAYLKQCGSIGATTRDLNLTCDVQNVATWISMLKKNGKEIVRRYERETDNGSRVHRYFLAEYTTREDEAA